MAFYLEKAIFVNRAPFEHLELNFKENGINVLTAVNGKGKTTIISYIVDAFYELAKMHYYNEFENKINKYYRISSPLYNTQETKPSFVYLRFINNNEHLDYLDINGSCTQEDYDQAINLEKKIIFQKFKRYLEKENHIKHWSISADDKERCMSIFDNNLLTYFPAYRYETPYYLNDPYSISLKYKRTSPFVGNLTNPIEIVSDISDLSNWILDVLLDLKSGENLILQNPKEQVGIVKESLLWENLNKILSQSLFSKDYDGVVRFGIGNRNSGATRISIINDIGNNHHKQICPSIFNLSSGELSLIALFGEILRQADNLKNNISIEEIQGIVLIDEVDKHLHIRLQKEVLPKLFNLFPKVQFIVSSHSPFLNMGLADESIVQTQIIDLDNNGIVCAPTNNDLYIEVYKMMVNENNRFYTQYKKLQNELNNINKPIVITEGKTDIIHILKAKEKLGITTEFKTIQEENQPNGDSDLKKLLDQLSKIKHNNKIIAIFDRDVSNTIKLMDDNGVGYKSYGNNVYGFCISAPQSRIDKGQDEISIEHLYSDDEIHTKLPNGCNLFFGDEFSKSGRHISNKQLILSNKKEQGKHKIIENNGGQAVYDNSDQNILAKKSDFAEAINNDQIQISQESWNNFKHIFDKIDAIINL